MYWKKHTKEEIKKIVFDALHKNGSYDDQAILGLPGTYLDREMFYKDAPFLEDAPFLSTMIANPNHIGCHTISEVSSIDVFKGTQQLEVDLIRICAEEIFGGKPGEQDGYVASGGTEANIEAMWISRNYFMKEHQAKINEIAIVYSEDSHYSMPKGANLLGLTSLMIPVDKETRALNLNKFESEVRSAGENGINHFIVILNLSTTMFGSVDDIAGVTSILKKNNISFWMHIDAAFGGFIYPFTNTHSEFSFKNPDISSITIDAHKMLQAPYGTGVFLIRKGCMKYVCTDEAQYIPGKDYTLCGSRSGANAVAIWMILHIHGSEGWTKKMKDLQQQTDEFCKELDSLSIEYFRNPFLNIISIKSKYVPQFLAEKYHLVADSYEHQPYWYKIVVMPHVNRFFLDSFFTELKAEQLHQTSVVS